MDTPDTPHARTTNLPTDVARLPIPGNAELLIYILALFLAMLVCWISDSLGSAELARVLPLDDRRVHHLARASRRRRGFWSSSGRARTGSNFSFVASAGTSVG